MKTKWRLPRGVDELLPPQAWELEKLRRSILDLYHSWGFEYIEPPVIEYLDALLVGSGEDLDLQTLKVVDQVTGRQLGVRADVTSQAVRIDSHSLVTDDIQRLCYAGNVVFANPQIGSSSRVPFKAGAELFGSSSLSADAEVVNLMIATAEVAGIQGAVLLLGHMGIYRTLIAALLETTETQIDEEALFKCIQRKSKADIEALLPDTPLAQMLADLPLLMGDPSIIETARQRLGSAPDEVHQALDDLEILVGVIRAQHDDIVIRIDVSELSGYGYHNGPVFALYHPEHGSALAQGGRYDGVGEAFDPDRGRAATGFDLDLKALVSAGTAETSNLIFAPWSDDSALTESRLAKIAELRNEGRRVRSALAEDEGIPGECSHILVAEDGEWRVKPA